MGDGRWEMGGVGSCVLIVGTGRAWRGVGSLVVAARPRGVKPAAGIVCASPSAAFQPSTRSCVVDGYPIGPCNSAELPLRPHPLPSAPPLSRVQLAGAAQRRAESACGAESDEECLLQRMKEEMQVGALRVGSPLRGGSAGGESLAGGCPLSLPALGMQAEQVGIETQPAETGQMM